MPRPATHVEHWTGLNREVASDQFEVISMHLGAAAKEFDVLPSDSSIGLPHELHATDSRVASKRDIGRVAVRSSVMGAKATPATDAATVAGISFRMHEYDHKPGAVSYALEASDALEIEPARIHKTLVLQTDAGMLVVAVVPADASCDVKAVAMAAGAKRAEMADPKAAQRSTGYVLGGISPLGQRQRLATVIDEDAQLWETIFVSAGRRGLEIELAAADLATLVSGTFAPIAKR
jgi:Cys-tRNA(Pro)/Cys-tRNA(Cys) deacylase